MVTSKMTLDAIKARPSKRNRSKTEATTEDDIRRHMIEDGENPDEALSDKDVISPWYIRKRLGMSQREFANTLGIPVATLRNWEQNWVAMEPATMALMRILAREPEAAPSGARSPRCVGEILKLSCAPRTKASTLTRYRPQSDKVMRLHAQTAMIENGFVHLPEEAPWPPPTSPS